MSTPVERRRPGLWNRINRARMSPRVVTRGFLWFRDFILLGFVTALIFAGVASVRSLRADDCRAANARRIEIRDSTLELIENDQFLVDLADNLSSRGLPDSFTVPLRQRYELQREQIREAYSPSPCPGDDL